MITPSLGLITWPVVSLIIIILPVICLISILRNEFRNNDKLIWIIVVIFLPFFGSLLYLLIGRKQKLNR